MTVMDWNYCHENLPRKQLGVECSYSCSWIAFCFCGILDMLRCDAALLSKFNSITILHMYI